MSDDVLPIEILQRLSRQEGVDVRPTLVRVLTDLFVQKEDHSPEDVARYEELVLQLLDVVGIDSRAAVARKLADEPRAPRSLITRLLADDVLVSAPILSRFRDVPRDTLLTLIVDGGTAEASAIASRRDIDADMVRTLAHHEDEFVVETLIANPAARFAEPTITNLVERATRSRALVAVLFRRDDIDAAALAPLYLHAGPGRRAEIRAAIAARPGRLAAETRPVRSSGALDAALIEATTLTGRGHVIAEALEQALGLRPDDAARLVTEPSGEPFVMMLRAAGVEPELVARALLVAQPEIAKSVPRVFELAEIAASTSPGVAAHLVNALAGLTTKSSIARYEPMLDSSGVMERAGAARTTHARRPAARTETSRSSG